jgi:hypothetical protein
MDAGALSGLTTVVPVSDGRFWHVGGHRTVSAGGRWQGRHGSSGRPGDRRRCGRGRRQVLDRRFWRECRLDRPLQPAAVLGPPASPMSLRSDVEAEMLYARSRGSGSDLTSWAVGPGIAPAESPHPWLSRRRPAHRPDERAPHPRGPCTTSSPVARWPPCGQRRHSNPSTSTYAAYAPTASAKAPWRTPVRW